MKEQEIYGNLYIRSALCMPAALCSYVVDVGLEEIFNMKPEPMVWGITILGFFLLLIGDYQ